MQQFWARVAGEEPTTRAQIVSTLLDDPEICTELCEAGLNPSTLLVEVRAFGEESAIGGRLREIVVALLPEMPMVASRIGRGEHVTDAGWELYGLFANPALTLATTEGREVGAADLAAHPVDPALPLGLYAARVLRVLARDLPRSADALAQAAARLERAAALG